MKKKRTNVSLRREYATCLPGEVEPSCEDRPRISERPRIKRRLPDPNIRSLQPLLFFADASDLDVSAVHVFSDPDEDGIALGFVTGSGTINVKLPRKLARRLIDGLAAQLR